MHRLRITAGLLLALLVSIAASAVAQEDWRSEYDALERAVFSAHQALADAGEGATSEALEAAETADSALIDWIAQAFETPVIQALPVDERQTLLTTRNRAQYLRARVRIRLGRCDGAAGDVAALRDRPTLDDELAAALDGVSDGLTDCVAAPTMATLQITCTPEAAEVWIDGALAGDGLDRFEVTPGVHQLSLRAEGFANHDSEITVSTSGEAVSVGPIALVSVGATESTSADDGEQGSHVVPFVLIGVGAALAGGGLLYDLGFSTTRDDLSVIQAECEAGCTAARYAEGQALQDDFDTGRIIDGLLYGGALVSVGVGLVLLLTDGTSDAAPVAVTPRLGRGGGVLEVGWRY